MIRTGSTITMEAWDMKYKPNSDWNHAWGSAPANIIVRQLWGIKPLEPGFTRAEIKPQPATLEWSEIKAPTIKGPISGSYKRMKNGNEEYLLEIPDGISAEFVFLPGRYRKISADGKRLKNPGGRIILSAGKHEIKLFKH